VTASKTPSNRGRLWIFPRCRGRAWIVFLAVAITREKSFFRERVWRRRL